MTLLLVFLIGFFTGLRTFAPAAVAAWGVKLGWLKLDSWLADIGTTWGVLVLTVLALAELAADKSPQMGNRTSFQGLSARLFMGTLAGACIAGAGGWGLAIGALLGAAGGAAGCFAGFYARKWAVRALRTRDLYVALVEDLICIGGSLWVVTNT